jgi:mannose-6-phosphate isomerase-like protein (cupin superfamily)
VQFATSLQIETNCARPNTAFWRQPLQIEIDATDRCLCCDAGREIFPHIQIVSLHEPRSVHGTEFALERHWTMKNMAENPTAAGKLKILRREESLCSRQYRGVFVQVIHEGDAFEVLRTEMDTKSALEDHEIGTFPVIHFVVEGSPIFVVGNQSGDLMPGDSISLAADEKYRITNFVSSRAVILSIVFKASEPEITAAGESR